MKKQKVLSLLFSINVIFSFAFPAFAMESIEPAAILNPLADTIISISTNLDESGIAIVTYDNLDYFVSTVHNQCPAITDQELALFIMQYTNQSIESIPENEYLSFLEYQSISITSQQIAVNHNSAGQDSNNSSRHIWQNALIELNTNYGKTGTTSNGSKYNVWVTATWLTDPIFNLNDVLILGTNQGYDSNALDIGYVNQKLKCFDCQNTMQIYRSVETGQASDNGLYLLYSGGIPYLKFEVARTNCTRCAGINVSTTHFTSYVKYGIKILNVPEYTPRLHASYYHGFPQITVTPTINPTTGMPSISGASIDVGYYLFRGEGFEMDI